MLGRIINISRFCTDDGPGIRTTVFLKGCPLSCVWCHNPESQSERNEILYDKGKCTGCMRCGAVCEKGCHSFDEGGHNFWRSRCEACGKCVSVCPSDALELSGKVVSAEEVVREVRKDMVFYRNSHGGVTISGGEPLYQAEFTSEILKQCRKDGIHTAIETSGVSGEEKARLVLEYCNLVLFDIKETDEERHRSFTGASLGPVLNTLHIIEEMHIPIVFRLPIIPGFNDRDDHFRKVRDMAAGMRECRGIEIMPYHTLGRYKYELLQRPYLCADIDEPAPETVKMWRESTFVHGAESGEYRPL